MKIRKIGDYDIRGDQGFYAVAISEDGYPINATASTIPAYAQIDWGMVPDALIPAIHRGEIVTLSMIEDDDLACSLWEFDTGGTRRAAFDAESTRMVRQLGSYAISNPGAPVHEA